MKVAIFQRDVAPYRISFYEKLGKLVDLTVYVTQASDSIEFINYKVKVLASTYIGNYVILHKIPSLNSYDAIVFIFDLRWPQLLTTLFKYRHKTLLWGHGMGRNQHVAGLRARMIKCSRGFIGYEKGSNDFFFKLSVPAEKLNYIGNTVEVENPEFSTSERKYFLYLGRLQARKNVKDALLAFKKLIDKNITSAKFMIVGDGDATKFELQNIIDENNLNDYVDFYPGTYSQAKTKEYFSSAIAYVSPGHVGLGVLHSFAFGVPVITYDVEGHAPEVENIDNGINGDIIPPNIDSLAKIMEDYVVNCDKTMLKGRSAYNWFINNRTMDIMVQNFYDSIKRGINL